MSGNGVFQIVLYFGVLTALAWPLGAFIARVYRGRRTFLSPVLRPGRTTGLPARRCARR